MEVNKPAISRGAWIVLAVALIVGSCTSIEGADPSPTSEPNPTEQATVVTKSGATRTAVEATKEFWERIETEAARPVPSPTPTVSFPAFSIPTPPPIRTIPDYQDLAAPTLEIPPALRTPTPEPIVASVTGCGGGTVEFWAWETEVQANLEQWNRIVDSGNLIIAAWNHYVTSTSSILEFPQIAGNVGFVEVADNYLVTASREREELAGEADQGRFGDFAWDLVQLTDAEIQMVTLFRTAAIDHDPDAWNSAIDVGATVDAFFASYETELDEACGYWEDRG